MTDEELKELVASLAVAQRETNRQMQETDRKMEESARQQLESTRITEENARQQLESTRIIEENARQQLESARKIDETDRILKESARKIDETDRILKESAQQIKELGKQIGGLGEKFGSFTEGLALPSMSRILSERFGMEVISPSIRVSKQGQHMEIDVLAYANSDVNEAYVVEVKSHARLESIEQLTKILERFRSFFPEHKDKAVYGILAAVDLSAELREKILKAGYYVARIHDQVFELDVPANFRPKAY